MQGERYLAYVTYAVFAMTRVWFGGGGRGWLTGTEMNGRRGDRGDSVVCE